MRDGDNKRERDRERVYSRKCGTWYKYYIKKRRSKKKNIRKKNDHKIIIINIKNIKRKTNKNVTLRQSINGNLI